MLRMVMAFRINRTYSLTYCHQRYLHAQKKVGQLKNESKAKEGPPAITWEKIWKSWNTSDKLLSLLLKNVIYNKDGLVGINKPYGLPVHKEGTRDVKKNRWRVRDNQSSLSLAGAVPDLGAALGMPELKLIKSTERFSTGVALFGASSGQATAVSAALVKAKKAMLFPTTYWALTVGIPAFPAEQEKVYIRMVEVGNIYLPIMDLRPSNRSLRQDSVLKQGTIRGEVLTSQGRYNAALVQLRSTSEKRHMHACVFGTSGWHAVSSVTSFTTDRVSVS
ncbi:PREDICTED: uncharacterized protein LOC106817345 [Priapulus caudatus]|uniref:Uncharacterized protein LOC106817345 n=1 Tax=Priapulus caudatus TaxID=37621 RepID=A0ABM1EZ68_PRICU|nr:PREDICTED: uncharacterized protein LOC106817345 [Priapulus caudatus]